MSDSLTALFSGDRCLSCTSCMANCPVMAAINDYRGPKLVAPAHGRLHFAQDDIEATLELCSNCKTCDRACPSGVSVSTLNMLRRADFYKTHPHTRAEDLLAHGELMAGRVRSIPFGATLANIGMNVGKALGVFDRLGLAGERDLPAYASTTFKDLFRRIKQPSTSKRLALFTGCWINDNEPHIGEAFVKVMNANGYEVLFDTAFNCCGSPMVVTGFMEEARLHAVNNVARILDWKSRGIPVVTPCTSCSLMLKAEYHELFGACDMQEAAENVYDAFEFLELLQMRGAFNDDLKPLRRKLLYHVPCHLKSQAIGIPAADLLETIEGVEVRTADAGCCGMAGNYGFRKDRYAVSMRIGANLFERVKRADSVDKVISDCATCRIQIQYGTGVKPCHPIEILAAAYR